MTDYLRLAISPDSDDAFMAWAIAEAQIDLRGLSFDIISADVQALNEAAASTTPPYDVSAISFGALPVLADTWSVLTTAASFGIGVGPKLVSAAPLAVAALEGARIAIPGAHTSARIALHLYLAAHGIGTTHDHYVPFDQIAATVTSGRTQAGVIIHEDGLRLDAHHLHRIADLGAWWQSHSGLPLPLGATAIRRNLPLELKQRACAVLQAAVQAGLDRRQEALAWARPTAKGLTESELEQYITDYVNALSVDFGNQGIEAIHSFLGQAETQGLIEPTTKRLEIIAPL